MRRLSTLGVLLLLGVTAFGLSQGQAFNSATHVYIAERVFPCTFDKINLYYGSIAPDFALYIPYDPDWSLQEAFQDTHYDYIYLPYTWWKPAEKAFAKGWLTHNEAWGADFYAHGSPPYYDGYVNIQADRLVTSFHKLEDSPELAHFAVEVAIDVLLARYHDPSLGLKLLWAAKYRSDKDLELMKKTFFMHKATVEAAEGFFRELVTYYARALALPDPFRMFAISELGVQVAYEMGVEITPCEAWEILKEAMDLCKDSDYMDVIELAIERIRTNVN